MRNKLDLQSSQHKKQTMLTEINLKKLSRLYDTSGHSQSIANYSIIAVAKYILSASIKHTKY